VSRSQSVGSRQHCNGHYQPSADDKLLLMKATNNMRERSDPRPVFYRLRRENHNSVMSYHFEQIDSRV